MPGRGRKGCCSFPLDCSIRFRTLVDAVVVKDGRWWDNDHFPADTEFTIRKGDSLNLIRLKDRGFVRTI